MRTYCCAIGIGLLNLVALGCSATGKQFAPMDFTAKSDRAVVYVYRPGHNYTGSAVAPHVRVDGEKIGRLRNNGYVHKVVSPGKHEVTWATEKKSAIPFEAVPGRSYFIEAEIQMGFWVGRPKLVMVPEETGKLAILGTRCCDRSP